MTGKLYLITNKINGKRYVGKTYRTLEARFAQHISEAKRETRPICAAIAKYGPESFIIELLSEHEKDELEAAEQSAISFYDTYNKGYNATLGGDGKKTLTVSNELILETYTKLGSVKACARELSGIGETSIRNRLRDMGVVTSVSKRYYKPIKVVELDMSFPTVKDCANYLEQLIPYSSKTIAVGIGRALKLDTPMYKGYSFQLL